MRLAFRRLSQVRRFSSWIDPGPHNPFKFPILDLRQFTQTMLSTSQNMECATNAMSYGSRNLSEFDKTDADVNEQFPHSTPLNIVYKCTSPLPDGALFIPQEMEDKYCIVYKKDKILIIRSWSADVEAVVYATRTGDKLTLTSVRTNKIPWSQLSVDFLIRSHVFRQLAVAPMDEKKITADAWYFSLYGRQVQFAAPAEDVATIEYPNIKPLRTESATERAMKQQQSLDQIKKLAAEAADRGELNVHGSFHGYTPLLGACALGNVELVRYLLQLGSDPMMCTDFGHSPLMEACGVPWFTPELGDLLIAAAPVGYVDFSGRPDHTTALNFACQEDADSLTTVEYLVSRGANVNASDGKNFSSLHRASEVGNPDIVKFLLEKGADKNQRSQGNPDKQDGWSALELAQRSIADIEAGKRKPELKEKFLKIVALLS